MTRLPLLLCLAVAVVWPATTGAQGFGPRPGSGMGGGQEKKEEKTGPAEAAPEEKEGEPEIPPLPAWPGQETRKLQFLQLEGYFRFRWNMHHGLAMGALNAGGWPYTSYNPISEAAGSTSSCAQRRLAPDVSGSNRGIGDSKCPATTIGGADMRLRLEPSINVTESIRIHTQFDLFDNLVLGSTPRSLIAGGTAPDVPMAVFSDGQAAPVAGRNTNTPALLVKRAWAEIDLHNITTLRVGRMPYHWGMGIFDNDGNCPNCNYGDSHDRIMLQSNLAGHTFAFGYDFSATGPNSLTVSDGNRFYGVSPVDLEKLDDVHQFFWMAGRIDPEEVVQDKMERGELVTNYGIYLLWRKQAFDYESVVGTGASAQPGPTLNSSVGQYASAMLERHAWMLMPDIWFKLHWKKLTLEIEGVLIAGSVQNRTDENLAAPGAPINILEFGWALRSEYRFLKDSLKVGLDMGMASGDDDEDELGRINRTQFHQIGTNTRGGWMSEYRFNYDYQVDWILFREILGTVANAAYFKPHISYDIIQSFGARFDIIYSVAHRPIGWPGNSPNLGVELDLEAYYKNEKDGFYASLVYGVMWPLGALARPAAIYPNSPLDPGAAHTFQGRLFVRF